MNRATATFLAQAKMEEHGLVQKGWRFEFDRAKKRMGSCSYRQKVITLSELFVDLNPEEEVKQTILHEVAHALAGPGTHHGPKWKQIMVEIGAKPLRCYDDETRKVKAPRGQWVIQCTNEACKAAYERHRLPPSYAICKKCRVAGRGKWPFKVLRLMTDATVVPISTEEKENV